jgi:quinol monooxygenase YgiN
MKLTHKTRPSAKVIQILLFSILLLSINNLSAQSAKADPAAEKKLIIAVTFKVPQENIQKFKEELTRLFQIIKKEEKAFGSYQISEEIQNPGTVLLYENWNTDLKTFGKGPSEKSYFEPFVKALQDLGISREAHLYKPL